MIMFDLGPQASCLDNVKKVTRDGNVTVTTYDTTSCHDLLSNFHFQKFSLGSRQVRIDFSLTTSFYEKIPIIYCLLPLHAHLHTDPGMHPSASFRSLHCNFYLF